MPDPSDDASKPAGTREAEAKREAEATREAEAVLAAKLDRPLDHLSGSSMKAVADAAETVAIAKREAAVRAAEVAREALARVAAIKAANALGAAGNAPGATSHPPTATGHAPGATDNASRAKPASASLGLGPSQEAPSAKAFAVETTAGELVRVDTVEPVLQVNVEAKPTVAVQPAMTAVQTAMTAVQPAMTAVQPAVTQTGAQTAAPETSAPMVMPDTAMQPDASASVSPKERAVAGQQAAERRMSFGRQPDDPSAVHRLAEQVRATAKARSTERREVKHRAPKKEHGAVLDPVAHQSGHGPAQARAKRKMVTPGVVFLVVLMGFFGAYATGNLPQFDRWTNSLLNTSHADNDAIVGTITHNWHGEAYIVAVVLLLIVVIMIMNASNARKERLARKPRR